MNCVISSFHSAGDENCALLACYAACSGNSAWIHDRWSWDRKVDPKRR